MTVPEHMYFTLNHSYWLICDVERECISSITMLMLTVTNDNNIASKFKLTVRILFVFG